MFFDFEFDEAHDKKNPPAGIVSGSVTADPSEFEIRIVFIASGNLFAGPEIVPLPDNGLHTVRLPLAAGIAFILEQHRLHDESGWHDGTPRLIRYRLDHRDAS